MSQLAYVFGSSPATLITARLLEMGDYKVTIYDPGNHFEKDNPAFLMPDLGVIPATELFQQSLELIAQAAGTEIHFAANELSPIHWNSDKFESFLGFGDFKYKSIPAISRLNVNSRWHTAPPINDLMLNLLGSFTGAIHPYSEISKIEVEASQIKSVEINGSKSLTAELFVFSESPKSIMRMIPAETLGTRDWTKLNRTPVWGQLCLEIPFTDSEWAQHQLCLLFPNSAEFEPWAGLPGETPSRWISYMPEEKLEDPESIGAEIRQLKKLLNKAFPGVTENLPEPSIHLILESCGSYDWLAGGTKIEENLDGGLLISELFSEYSGLAASIDVACAAMARLNEGKKESFAASEKQPTLLSSNPLP